MVFWARKELQINHSIKITWKEIIPTLDYELFLAKETRSVKKCIIESTKKLASILEKNVSSMTIF